MRAALRPASVPLGPVLLALLLAAAGSWAGLLAFPRDFEVEALPAALALARGDVGDFLALAPAYGGSLVLRAPFVLAAGALGAGPEGVWLAAVLPALLASAALAVVLWRGLDRRGRRGAAWIALAVAGLNPVTGTAVELGHPEEALGGVLCAAAALAAVRGMPVATGVLLGLAGANKPWAVVAALPVLLALSRAHLRAVAVAGLTCAGILAPLVLGGGVAVASAAAIAVAPPTIFEPQQLFWFLGEPAPMVAGAPGDRTAPDWLGPLSHPLAVGAGVAIALGWLPRRLRGGAPGDAVLVLALVLLARCLLDTWAISYYFLPFVLALGAWEAGVAGRAPWGAAAAAAAVVLTDTLPVPDHRALATLAWTLPAALAISLRCFAPARAASLAHAVGARLPRRMPGAGARALAHGA